MMREIAVVGSGYMGGGIAQVFGLAGARVALADVSAEIARDNYHRLIAESKEFVAEGLFPEGATETLETNLWPAASLAGLAGGFHRRGRPRDPVGQAGHVAPNQWRRPA
ncbi:3-hydroxyacyl-CoA dehydrogenase NAD-binding domain-containing protein [Mycolicibacterium sp.]|uniref:3-hydroxyacyl-CoA dehydrogenase NAD-binding domain-containing protein n=1 Tax=Mycolicibacterium sp. TaxID=2320850 RepID=UPI0037C7AC23